METSQDRATTLPDIPRKDFCMIIIQRQRKGMKGTIVVTMNHFSLSPHMEDPMDSSVIRANAILAVDSPHVYPPRRNCADCTGFPSSPGPNGNDFFQTIEQELLNNCRFSQVLSQRLSEKIFFAVVLLHPTCYPCPLSYCAPDPWDQTLGLSIHFPRGSTDICFVQGNSDYHGFWNGIPPIVNLSALLTALCRSTALVSSSSRRDWQCGTIFRQNRL
jgi:hypothetical protein